MMTEWYKLWEEKPMHLKSYDVVEDNKLKTRFSYIINDGWLDRVKAEGDRLQERNKYLEDLTDNDAILLDKQNLQRQKLDAIRDTNPKHIEIKNDEHPYGGYYVIVYGDYVDWKHAVLDE